MTDPKLREARIAEAKRRALETAPPFDHPALHAAQLDHLIDLIEQGWRPEPEVDAVTLAAREWITSPANVDATYTDAFRAGHAHALANHPDTRRMDWLEGQHVKVWTSRDVDASVSIVGAPNSNALRTKIDRAMEQPS